MSTAPETHFYSGRVVTLKRLQNSQSGNPRWSFTLDDGTRFTTEPDAVVGYAISETEHDNHWVKLELNGNDRVVGIEVLGTATRPKIGPQKLSEAEKLAQEITLLWDARISKGMPFLNAEEDVPPLRAILERHETPELRTALLDAVTEALQDAADDFPDDLPGRALVSEWLEERAAKYRSGELEVL